MKHDHSLGALYNASPKIRVSSAPKKLQAQNVKFGPISYNFRLWSRISPERVKVPKIGKRI